MTRKEFWAWLDWVYHDKIPELDGTDTNWIMPLQQHYGQTTIVAIVLIHGRESRSKFMSWHNSSGAANKAYGKYTRWLKQWGARQ